MGTVDASRNTVRIAVALVLVAWTLSVPPRPPGWKSARVTLTTSGGGGAPVVTVIMPDTVPTPPQQATAVTVTGVLELTTLVVTGKSTRLVFALTTASAGTWTTAGVLLVSCTRAP